MKIDYLSQYNYIQMNVKVAQIFGRDLAIYWAELLNVYARVVNKKLDEMLQNNGLFELDREYIAKRTTINIEDQAALDKVLVNAGILGYDPNNESDINRIMLDVGKMEEIMQKDDPDEIHQLQKTLKVKKTDEALAKRFGKASMFRGMVVEPDNDLKEAYHNWINTLIIDKKDFFNTIILNTFIETVRAYSENKAIQLKLIQIATLQGWKDAGWAISSFERDYKNNATFLGTIEPKKVGKVDTSTKF